MTLPAPVALSGPGAGKKRTPKPTRGFAVDAAERRERFFKQHNNLRRDFYAGLRAEALKAVGLEIGASQAAAGNVVDSERPSSRNHSPRRGRGGVVRRHGPPLNYFPRAEEEADRVASGKRHSAGFIGRQIVLPDMLIDAPSDLAHNWLVYKRPEGQRVILVSVSGRGWLFNKSGFELDSFPCALPSGITILDGVLNRDIDFEVDSQTGDAGDSKDIDDAANENEETQAMEDPNTTDLGDCSPMEEASGAGSLSEKVNAKAKLPLREGDEETVKAKKKKKAKPKRRKHTSKMNTENSTIYIVDVLTWNDCNLVDTPADCRYFLLRSRFDELEDRVVSLSPTNRRRIRLVDAQDATKEELTRVYYTSPDPYYISDSIMFVMKEALYVPGLNPLYLSWKDERVSRYPIDTSDVKGETIPERQSATLYLTLEGNLVTEDECVVGSLSADRLESVESEVRKRQSEYKRRGNEGPINPNSSSPSTDEDAKTNSPERQLIRVVFDGIRMLSPAVPGKSAGATSRSGTQYQSEISKIHGDSASSLPAAGVCCVELCNPLPIGLPSAHRQSGAESYSRLVHQYMMRERRRGAALDGILGLTFSDIIAAAGKCDDEGMEGDLRDWDDMC